RRLDGQEHARRRHRARRRAGRVCPRAPDRGRCRLPDGQPCRPHGSRSDVTRVAVTGSAGKAGRAVVGDLVDHGYDVLGIDLDVPGEHVVCDVTDYDRVLDVLAGVDAVVHLAAIPAPGLRPDEETFRVNTLSTYNVFAAAP